MVISESTYKIVLCILCIGLFLVRMLYQSVNSRSGTVHLHTTILEQIRVGLTSLWLIPALLYIFTPWIDAFSFSFNDTPRRVGAVLLSLGIMLFWWAHIALGRNWSPFLQIRPNHVLVMEGPYRWIRHPMYAAIFLCGSGITLISANWLLSVAYFAPVVVLYITRVEAEEQLLLTTFGETYQDYRQRTGCLLPRIFR